MISLISGIGGGGEGKNELINETETGSQMQKTNLWLSAC